MQAILIIGSSGTGKSTSTRNLKPEETFYINVLNKPLPFPKWKSKYTEFNTKTSPNGNLLVNDNPATIAQVVHYVANNKPEIKTLIIDDGNYIMQNEYIRRSSEKGFEKFTVIGTEFAKMIQAIHTVKREDLTIIMMMHPEIDVDATGQKQMKAKAIGKLVDNYLTIEGMFSIVLYTKIQKANNVSEYYFETQNNGYNTAKSPMGMFDSLLIPNDLTYVIQKMEEYNN